MLKEVIEYLKPKNGGYYIDCTLGGGGYTEAILEIIGDDGKLLAIDADEEAIKNFQTKNQKYKNKNIILANDNFKNLQDIIKRSFPGEDIKFDGIVLDLGLSSNQLADRNRGFSFRSLESPLDMAFGQRRRSDADYEDADTTQMIINNWPKEKIEKIIREYGEERWAKRISEAIDNERKKNKIKTVGELVVIIKSAIPARFQKGQIHFATKTFQALRIATNDELENLKIVLPAGLELLKEGGRLVIVSFHSLEDRIVKNYLKNESKDCLCPPRLPICSCGHKAKLKILTKKPVEAGEEEKRINPRARSAKMRAAERI